MAKETQEIEARKNTVFFYTKCKGRFKNTETRLQTNKFETTSDFETVSVKYCILISKILNLAYSLKVPLTDFGKSSPGSNSSGSNSPEEKFSGITSIDLILIALYTKPFSKITENLIGWGMSNGICTTTENLFSDKNLFLEEFNSSVPQNFARPPSDGVYTKVLDFSKPRYQTSLRVSAPTKFSKKAISPIAPAEKKVTTLILEAITQVLDEDTEHSEYLWTKLLSLTKLEPKVLREELLSVEVISV